MSAPAAAEEATPVKPKKSKKLLIIVALALVVLGAAAGGWAYWSKQKAAQADADGEEVVAAHAAPKEPPTFLPLENMVVNLADPGGERMAQIGITIEVADAHAADKVKAYLPSIRSGILMLISQRTSVELLQREGKDQLAQDILLEVSRPLGFGEETHAKPAKKTSSGSKKKEADAAETNPVKGVLFSSFIVQ